MKKIKCALAAIFISAIVGKTQEVNKDVMIKKIFSTLQQKDEAAFLRLFPDSATLKAFFRKMSENNPAMVTMMNEFDLTEMERGIRNDFKHAIEKGEKAGVEWAAARLTGFTADSAFTRLEELSVSKLSGKMYFTSNTKEYFIAYDEVIWFDNKGWYGVDLDRVGEKSRENEEDEDDFMLDPPPPADSAAILIDEQPEPAQKKPATQPKPPVKKKPAATKTQAPARKP